MAVAIKILGLLVLFLVCVFVGFSKSSGLKHRVDNLEKIYKGLLELSGRLRYEGTQKQRLLEDSFYEARFLIFGNERVIFSESALDKDDKKIFNEFYEKLGSADYSAEIDRVNLYLSIFKQRLENALENSRVLGKIYRTLGVCAGAAGCILLF